MSRTFVLSGWLALVACSSGQGAGAVNGAGGVCETAARDAQKRVHAVLEENLACKEDADCAIIIVSASCFNSCARSVSLTGKGAVDRASTLVEASECKIWKDAGCAREDKPCAPPEPPACREGKCL